MRRLISAGLFFSMKLLSHCFFRTKVGWLNDPHDRWQNIRLFVFLNHTSLFEPIFVGAIPFGLLWDAAGRMVAPGADKTLRRPIAGTFYKFLVPQMVSITRKRDHTWEEFLQTIDPSSMIAILPEGRMKRRTGLDRVGNPMSVRGGVADILKQLNEGNILIGYSGGLHHVQAPGDLFPRLFKTIRINFEQMPIAEYKSSLQGSPDFRQAVINDMEERMKHKSPNSPETK